MRIELERCVPAGIDARKEHNGVFFCVGLGIGWSVLCFLARYFGSYNDLFTYRGGKRIMLEGAEMADFAVVLEGAFVGFAVAAVCLAALAVWHYAYHFQGSRSIYTMRRLPDRWELLRRCVALPLAGIVACLIAAALLLLVYYAVYQLVTPEQCLRPDQWAKLWQTWMGVELL